MAAAAVGEAEGGEEREEELPGMPLYAVACDLLPVRSAASADASVLGERRRGDCVAAAARRGSWLRLAVWRGALEAWACLEAEGAEGQAALEPAPRALGAREHLALRLEGTQQLLQRQLLRRGLGAAAAGASCSNLYLGSTASGVEARCSRERSQWSVHAARAFLPGELVERCDLAPLRSGVTPMQTGKLSPDFARSIFWQGQGDGRPARGFLPLGFALLYRLTQPPEDPALSASWSGDGSALLLHARRRLEAGEELSLPADLRADLLRRAPAEGGGPPQCSRTLEAPSSNGQGVAGGASGEASIVGSVRVGQSPIHGRGVFAGGRFRRGALVELCPTLRMAETDTSCFIDFVMTFELTDSSAARQPSAPEKVAVASLGSGMLYNHSGEPNAKWSFLPSLGGGLVVISAAREIAEGEELFINYGEGYWRKKS